MKKHFRLILKTFIGLCLYLHVGNQTVQAQYNELDPVVVTAYVSDVYTQLWFAEMELLYSNSYLYDDWYYNELSNNFQDPCEIDPNCDENYTDTGTTTTTDPNIPQFGLDYKKTIPLKIAPVTVRGNEIAANHIKVGSVALHVANMPTANLSSIIDKYNNTANSGNAPVNASNIKSENIDNASTGAAISEATTNFNDWLSTLFFLQMSALYDKVNIDDCSNSSWCDSDFEENDDFVGFEQEDTFFINNPDDSYRFKSHLSPDSYYVTGLLAGLGDGIIETGDLVYTLGEYAIKNSAPVLIYNLITDFEGTLQAELDKLEMAKGLIDLVNDPIKQAQILNTIEAEIGNWFDQVTFDKTLAEAGYQHGKLIFEVLGALVGVAEVKALLKAGQFSATAINTMRKLDGMIAAGFKFKRVDGATSLVDDVGEVIAPGLTNIGPTENLINLFNDVHRSIIDEYKASIGNLSNKLKGNYGEIATDVKLSEKGYIPLHTRITDIEANGHNGIDGVFEKDGKYYIVESKYSSTTTPSLNSANGNTGLPKQMSEDWIERDGVLADALGGNETLAQQIINSDYIRVVAAHGPDDNVVYKLISGAGDVATIGNVWIP